MDNIISQTQTKLSLYKDSKFSCELLKLFPRLIQYSITFPAIFRTLFSILHNQRNILASFQFIIKKKKKERNVNINSLDHVLLKYSSFKNVIIYSSLLQRDNTCARAAAITKIIRAVLKFYWSLRRAWWKPSIWCVSLE